MEKFPFLHLPPALNPEDVGNACFYNGVIRNECAYLVLTESRINFKMFSFFSPFPAPCAPPPFPLVFLDTVPT